MAEEFCLYQEKEEEEGIYNAYKRVSEIKSEALFYRHDIGFKAMKGE